MTVENKVLVQTKYVETVETDQYSGSNVVTVLDVVSVANVGSNTAVLNLYLVPSGGTVGVGNNVLVSRSIAPGETYLSPEMVGQVLASGDALYAKSDQANSLVLRASGRVIS